MQRTGVETRTYTLADAAAVLGTSEERVLQLVEAGLPERAPGLRRPGARALTFQDLVLLRNAKRLVDQAIAPARVASPPEHLPLDPRSERLRQGSCRIFPRPRFDVPSWDQ